MFLEIERIQTFTAGTTAKACLSLVRDEEWKGAERADLVPFLSNRIHLFGKINSL